MSMASLRVLSQRAPLRYSRSLSTAAGEAAVNDAKVPPSKRAIPIADSFGDISISNFSVNKNRDMPFDLNRIANNSKSSMSSRLAKNRVQSTGSKTPAAAAAAPSSSQNAASVIPKKEKQAAQKQETAAPAATATKEPEDEYERIFQRGLAHMQERQQHRARADAEAEQVKQKRRQQAMDALTAAAEAVSLNQPIPSRTRDNNRREGWSGSNTVRARSGPDGRSSDRPPQRRMDRSPRQPRAVAPHRKVQQQQKMLSDVGSKEDVDAPAISSEDLYAIVAHEESKTREAQAHLGVQQTNLSSVFGQRSRVRRAKERSMSLVTMQKSKARHTATAAKRTPTRPSLKYLEKTGGVYERLAPGAVLGKAGKPVGPLVYAQLALTRVQNANPQQRKAALEVVARHVAAAAKAAKSSARV